MSGSNSRPRIDELVCNLPPTPPPTHTPYGHTQSSHNFNQQQRFSCCKKEITDWLLHAFCVKGVGAGGVWWVRGWMGSRMCNTNTATKQRNLHRVNPCGHRSITSLTAKLRPGLMSPPICEISQPPGHSGGLISKGLCDEWEKKEWVSEGGGGFTWGDIGADEDTRVVSPTFPAKCRSMSMNERREW